MPTAATPAAQAALGKCVAWHLRLDKFSSELAANMPEDQNTPPAKTSALRAALSCYTNKARPQFPAVIKAKLAWLDRTAAHATETIID